MIIGLDYCAVHELLHCVHLEFLGKVPDDIRMLNPQGKIVHCLANDLVHEGRVNFGFGRLEGAVLLFPNQRLMCSGSVVTSARVTQLKKAFSDGRQAHQEERGRFATGCATDALIERN